MKNPQLVITDKTLAEFIDGEVDRLKALAKASKTKDLMPVLIAVNRPELKEEAFDLIIMGMADLPLDDEKHKLFEAMGMKLGKEGKHIVAAVFSSEVWVKHFKKASDQKIAIRKYDDKGEALLVAAATIDGRAFTKILEMKRDDDGNITELTDKGNMEKTENYLLDRFFYGYAKGYLLK